MANHYLFFLTIVSALGCGLMAGIFFAFSNFVMRALSSISREHAIVAMQEINIAVLNPVFMLAFFGTALLCAAILVAIAISDGQQDAAYLLAGCTLYLVGNIGVTALFNVPMNNALAGVDTATEGAIPVWQRYLSIWTFWNHVRTVTALCAATAFTLGATASAAC